MLKYAIATVEFWLANGIESCDTWRKSLDGKKALTHIENVETLFPFETSEIDGMVLCRRNGILYEVGIWEREDDTFQEVINSAEWTPTEG